MSKLEAYQLLDSVESALGTNAARVVQIGNGEFCVIVRKGGYFLWSFDDWLSYCDAEGLEHVYVSQGGGNRSYINAVQLDEVYALVI